uniref:Protein krueppel n=1 Tax=Homalodisca liturata TaxID=320908 RepID=A0A1B6J2C4_9HEMI
MKNANIQTSFENHCRICRCKKERNKLFSIFESEDLLEKITSCLPITIHVKDQLPHNICDDCLSMVEDYFELVNKAKSSEEYFFNYLKNRGAEGIKAESAHEIIEENNSISLDLDGSFQCDLCGIQLSEAIDLHNHIQENHFNQSIPPNTEFSVQKICSLCGQLFESDEVYVLHKCESQHKCEICKKLMPTKCLLNRHIQHSCKPLYYCPHCHKTFSVKPSFLKHVQIHTGEANQSDCLACNRKLHTSGEVTEHTCDQNLNGNSSKKYKCYICGQSYKRQLNLAKHCLQHEPRADWKFKCQHCDEIFEKERTLHTHYEKIHKMPKSWICRFCGKSLSTKLSVQIHERIHTQVKPYVCEWCGNAFRSKANLIQHHAKHTGIRRHKCPVCGKMFSRTFFLKTHLRVHTGERPYQCDICEQRFTQVGDMRRHRKRHDNASQSQSQPTVIIVRRSGQVAQSSDLPVVAFDSIPIETVELKIESSPA